ncbi:MAG: ABC transporter substrate-binding protein, partial [Chloroflexota bacterium]
VVPLRQDVLWHDGIPFTAADVVYTVGLLQSPDFPGPTGLREFWQTIEVEAINDYLVRFRLAQPLATFPEAIRIGILPEHALRGTNAAQLAAHPFNLDPIGTGPYQLEQILVDDDLTIRQVDLRVAPNFRLRPEAQDRYQLDRVRFRIYDDYAAVLAALRAGEAEGYAGRQLEQRADLQQIPGLTVYQTIAPNVGLLIFNWVDDDVAYFRQERVRQALALGLDRTSMVERNMINRAVRADSPIPRLSWAYNYGDSLGARWTYNLDQARAEIALIDERLDRQAVQAAEESGEEPQTDGPVLSFDILTLDDPALVGLAREIAAQWSLLNVEATVEAVDLRTYNARLRDGDFDTALVEYSKDGNADPDLYAFWHQGQYPDGRNYGGVNERAISEALERARFDVNGINRKIHYDNFQRAFIGRAVAIPLYYPLFTYVVAPRVDGVQLGFIGAAPDRFMTIGDWRLTG